MMEDMSFDPKALYLTEDTKSSDNKPTKKENETIEMKKVTFVSEQDKRLEMYRTIVRDASQCLTIMKGMKIDVITFVYMFSYIVRSISSATMIMEKVCKIHLNYPNSVCDDLKEYPDIKVEVEKMTNNYHLFHTLIQLAPSSILICSLGPWSDKYGRKPPLILALVGIILDGIGAIICAANMSIRAEWYLITAVFTGISGGFIGVLTIVYSYVSDTSTPKTRTLKYAMMEMAFGLGMPFGALAGGWIYKYSGYVAVFSTSVAGHVFGLLWVLFVIEETRGLDNKDSVRTMIRNLFSMKVVVDSFRAAAKKRPHGGRKQIWLLLLSMSCIVLTLASTSGIAYLYVHHMYDWENTKYSTVSAIFAVLGLVSMIVAVPLFTKVLKWGDPALGFIGSASLMIRNLLYAFASKEWLYYCGSFAGLLSSLATLAGRSRISKIVPKSEMGKVFAFVSTAESLLPIAATAIFSQVFNATLEFFSGLVYLILGLVLLISLAIFTWLALLPEVDYAQLEEENIAEENSAQKPPIKEKC